MPNALEFFAGGGMARAGLGATWRISFANDLDVTKAEIYKDNWGGEELVVGDVAALASGDIPGNADLSWASFPCQDLSLAGSGGGLESDRSGTFWPYWRLMEQLVREGRAPSIIALENVYGAVRSHRGKDFAAIIQAFADLGYKVGALLIDAVRFLPQSRLRLFIVGVKDGTSIPPGLISDEPVGIWHPTGLKESHKALSESGKAAWIWWNLPEPSERNRNLDDLIEDEPTNVDWDPPEKTEYLLSLMTELNRNKVKDAMQEEKRVVGTVYRRTRPDGNGGRTQRAEVRFDGISGCLRTPSGGSSRQTILVVEGKKVRSRLLSPREAARLMGLPDSYKLPERYNAAYHLAGDGVAVPVVRHLAENLFEPVLALDANCKGKVAA